MCLRVQCLCFVFHSPAFGSLPCLAPTFPCDFKSTSCIDLSVSELRSRPPSHPRVLLKAPTLQEMEEMSILEVRGKREDHHLPIKPLTQEVMFHFLLLLSCCCCRMRSLQESSSGLRVFPHPWNGTAPSLNMTWLSSGGRFSPHCPNPPIWEGLWCGGGRDHGHTHSQGLGHPPRTEVSMLTEPPFTADSFRSWSTEGDIYCIHVIL